MMIQLLFLSRPAGFRPADILLFAGLLWAAVCDRKSRTIPNAVPLLLTGLRALVLVGRLCGPASAAAASTAGSQVGAACLAAFRAAAGALCLGGPLLAARLLTRLCFRRRGIGAGDVKLALAAGLWMSPDEAFCTLVLTAASAVLAQAAGRIRTAAFKRRPEKGAPEDCPGKDEQAGAVRAPEMALAPYLLAGAAAARLLGRLLPLG